MKYSFTASRKKSILTLELQLIFIFFAITFFMLFMTYMFLLFKDYRFGQDQEYIKKQLIEINDSQLKMEDRIQFIKEEKALGEKIYTKNRVLKDSVTNLFDLVPSRITLSEAKLLENGLILYGITPNEDIYNFMLQAPLRSIFSKTYSSFYPAENGWLRFVSTNYVNEDDLRQKKAESKVDKEVDDED